MLDEIYARLTAAQRDFLRNLIDKDELTGIYDRGFFNHRIEEEVHRARRFNTPLCLMIADIDDFKKYQDKHTRGHIGGDEALRQVSKTLVDGVRNYDVVCRYGGEEFAVICPGTDLKAGKLVADRLRESVHEACSVTISVGLADYPENSSNTVDLIYHADKALYFAKNRGKNKVVTFDRSML